jgi:5-methylcytosine-specific restriction enzyme A
MPTRIATACMHPGCPEAATVRGCCARHAQQAARMYDNRRGSAASRGYGHGWSTKIRPRILRRDPICRDPFETGCMDPSEHVDHVIPKDAGGTDHDVNLWGLCKSDHSRKTLVEQGVSFKRICSCEVATHCRLQEGSSSVILLACNDHAEPDYRPINEWPQMVCFQQKGRGGSNF